MRFAFKCFRGVLWSDLRCWVPLLSVGYLFWVLVASYFEVRSDLKKFGVVEQHLATKHLERDKTWFQHLLERLWHIYLKEIWFEGVWSCGAYSCYNTLIGDARSDFSTFVVIVRHLLEKGLKEAPKSDFSILHALVRLLSFIILVYLIRIYIRSDLRWFEHSNPCMWSLFA